MMPVYEAGKRSADAVNKVFLDGEEVDEVFKANTHEGYIERYKKENGRFILDSQGDVAKETLWGVVTVSFHPDDSND